MSNKHIGKHIQKLREAADMSQDQLAEKIGKSKSLISFVENKGKVSDKTLDLIAKALKVPFDNLKVFPIIDLESQKQSQDQYKLRISELERETELLRSIIDKQEKIIELMELNLKLRKH